MSRAKFEVSEKNFIKRKTQCRLSLASKFNSAGVGYVFPISIDKYKHNPHEHSL
jgi:hypothetical protein